jgi:hypothetical protein
VKERRGAVAETRNTTYEILALFLTSIALLVLMALA